jgi:hypothetical protein
MARARSSSFIEKFGLLRRGKINAAPNARSARLR